MEVGQVQSDNTHLQEHCELQTWSGGHIRQLMDSINENSTNCVRTIGILGLNKIENYLTSGTCTTIYRLGWPPMIVAMKGLARVQLLPASF